MAVQTEIGRRLEDAIKRCWEIGGEPTMLRTSSAGGEFLRRWILSGVLVTTAERHHARRTKAARRRNRGRAPFTRFR